MSDDVKQREHDTWKKVAPGWKKHDRRFRESTRPASDRMIEAAWLMPGKHVLDIACGVGEPAFLAARAVAPSGSVLATDFVGDMIGYAKEIAVEQQVTNVAFQTMDGETLDVPRDTFDAVLCRWGVMFMPDPLACLRGAREALKERGRLAIACWAAPERNPWAAMPMAILKRYADVPTPPPGAPGLFALAERDRLAGLLREAGFKDVDVVEVGFTMYGTFDSGAEFFQLSIDLAGPIARIFSSLSPEQQAKARAEIIAEAEKHRVDGKVGLQGVTWVASGTK